MPDAEPHRAIALMRESSRMYAKLFGKRFRELKLTPEEARTLAHLSAGETMRQRQLADLMHVQPIALSRLVDRLESRGFAERRPSPSDRRAKEIHLTAKGRAAARKILAINDGLAAQLADHLETDELAILVKGLGVVRQALEEMG
jgi:DNA-binding MarR family transcriptional regulator